VKQTQQSYHLHYQLLAAILTPFFEKFGWGVERTRIVTMINALINSLQSGLSAVAMSGGMLLPLPLPRDPHLRDATERSLA